MTQFKQTCLILIISVLIYSCNTKRQESNGGQNVEPMVFNCLIDSIGKNDTLHINYSTRGCEHYFTEELRIFRKSDSLFADLTVTIPHRQELFQPLTQLLRDSSIFAYAEFEKTGRILKTGELCTTSEEYVISLKTDSIKFEDNGCEYDGYYILKNKIFGQTEIERYNKKIYR